MKIFRFMVFRLLENVFVSQIFTKPPRKTLPWVLTITHQAGEGLFFLKFVFPNRTGETGNYVIPEPESCEVLACNFLETGFWHSQFSLQNF